jgi:hypothetical protein
LNTGPAAKRGQRHLDPDLLAVLAYRLELEALADDRAPVLPQMPAQLQVTRTEFFRQEQARQRAPNGLLACPPENPLRSRIPFQHAAVLVQLDERLERMGNYVPRHLLAFEQRCLHFLLRGDIAGGLGGADDRP